MSRYVVLVDTSPSMRCYLEGLKHFLTEEWLDYLSTLDSPPLNNVALISFENDVRILSHYTRDVDSLKTLVEGLTTPLWSRTAFHDAILVGLVFEHPKPDELYVWSDQYDTCSDASEATWSDLSSALGVPVTLCPPYVWMEEPGCRPYTEGYPMVSFSGVIREMLPEDMRAPITPEMALARAKEIAMRVKTARVIEKPEDFLKLKPVKKKE